MQGEARKGIAAIIAACAIWGFAPLLYHRIAEVPALEIMAHRTLWTAVLLGAIAAAQGRLGEAKALVTGPDRGRIVAAALLIGFNWGLFIWAVTAGRAVEASLGYYILPLVSAVLGRVRLATAGLAAYLNPTLQLASAVWIMGEPVTVWHGVALALIWAAIALYSAAAWMKERPVSAP